MPRPPLDIDPDRVVSRLPTETAHIGVYDTKNRRAYAARGGAEKPAIDFNHAELFRGGGGSLLVKDRFICFWFYPPGTCNSLVQGYPIDAAECNLLVRLDPSWSYQRQALLPRHQTAAIEANINFQVDAAASVLLQYRKSALKRPLSVHMIGPRATDSLFYAHRWEPKY